MEKWNRLTVVIGEGGWEDNGRKKGKGLVKEHVRSTDMDNCVGIDCRSRVDSGQRRAKEGQIGTTVVE